MIGAEHYREAERLLKEAANPEPNSALVHTEMRIARAQVHATLALAAAQSYVPAEHGYSARERYGAVTR